MSYSTNHKPDLLEKDAAALLREAGYVVAFRTSTLGRELSADFESHGRRIKWVMVLYRGRFSRDEVDEAVRDIKQFRGSLGRNVQHGLTTSPDRA